MIKLSKLIMRRRQRRLAELCTTASTSVARTRFSPLRTNHNYTLAFVNRLVQGYGEIVEQRLEEGYEAYLLTFMFQRLPGSAAAVAATMERAIEHAYRRTLTLVVRKPHTTANRQQPLIWLGCPDYPVPKRQKQRLRDVVVNDGRHVHVVALVPPYSRLRRPYDAMIEHAWDRFTPDPIARVHVRHIAHDPAAVVGYGFKQLSRRRCDFAEVIALPRARAELPNYVDPCWVLARHQADATPVPRDPLARHRRPGQAAPPPAE